MTAARSGPSPRSACGSSGWRFTASTTARSHASDGKRTTPSSTSRRALRRAAPRALPPPRRGAPQRLGGVSGREADLAHPLLRIVEGHLEQALLVELEVDPPARGGRGQPDGSQELVVDDVVRIALVDVELDGLARL